MSTVLRPVLRYRVMEDASDLVFYDQNRGVRLDDMGRN